VPYRVVREGPNLPMDLMRCEKKIHQSLVESVETFDQRVDLHFQKVSFQFDVARGLPETCRIEST